jgi:L-gulonate 5-dehydrogenase
MPERNLVEMPDNISAEKACLAEPLACGWHGSGWVAAAARMAGWPMPASVIGGGAIGLGAALALKAQGARMSPSENPTAPRHAGTESAGDFAVRGTRRA